jgi:hypothetical protein
LSPLSPEKAVPSSQESVKFSDLADLADTQGLDGLGSVVLAVTKKVERFIEHRPLGKLPATESSTISTNTESDAIAGVSVSIFEGELGDPRFVELA